MAMLEEILAIVHCSFRTLETMEATEITDNKGVRLISNVDSMIMLSITLACTKETIKYELPSNST